MNIISSSGQGANAGQQYSEHELSRGIELSELQNHVPAEPFPALPGSDPIVPSSRTHTLPTRDPPDPACCPATGQLTPSAAMSSTAEGAHANAGGGFDLLRRATQAMMSKYVVLCFLLL